MSYIKNITNDDIGPITFEGFEFTIPANSVCAIYTPAGEWFTTHNFRVEAKDPTPPNWVRRGETTVNIGGDGGAPTPPIFPVKESDWDGKTYATVTRFRINPSRIPDRGDLMRLAEERGVDKETRDRFDMDQVENDQIAEAINKLPVPEQVRIPENSKVKTK